MMLYLCSLEHNDNEYIENHLRLWMKCASIAKKKHSDLKIKCYKTIWNSWMTLERNNDEFVYVPLIVWRCCPRQFSLVYKIFYVRSIGCLWLSKSNNSYREVFFIPNFILYFFSVYQLLFQLFMAESVVCK